MLQVKSEFSKPITAGRRFIIKCIFYFYLKCFYKFNSCYSDPCCNDVVVYSAVLLNHVLLSFSRDVIIIMIIL